VSDKSIRSRRTFLKGLGLTAGALVLNGCDILTKPSLKKPSLSGCKVNDMPTSYAQPFTQSAEKAPNVIVIFTDDQGWGDTEYR